jgi:DNA modification methylase
MTTTERFEKVGIDKLIPYARNSRTHSKEQILQLRSSLREFGFVNPVLADKAYNILAGHGRVLAAKEEGISEVPVVFVEHLTEAQKRAYIIADNRLALNAGWDADMLSVELADLQGADFDLALLGFDNKELDKLLSADKEIKEDDFDVDEALKETAFAKTGDLWHLGKHRLLVGDSTKADDVALLMDGSKANLVLTDPPYLISYDKGKAGTIKNDDLSDEQGYEFLLSAFKQAEGAMANDASIYIFHADTKGEIFRRAFREAGFHLSMNCIWKKSSFTLGRMPYQVIHEPCLFGWKAKGKHVWNTDRKQSTVWEFDKPHKNDIHSTMKPVPLLGYLIGNSTLSGCIVLDLFSGSFSTGMACEQLDRVCYAMELDEAYASASIKRYAAEYGGENVTVERDGEALGFAELEKGATTK